MDLTKEQLSDGKMYNRSLIRWKKCDEFDLFA